LAEKQERFVVVADPKALYVIEGGINDILHVKSLSPDELGLEIATALAGSEQALRQAGARNFVIPTLFNIGLLPVAQKYAVADLAATQATNVGKEEAASAQEMPHSRSSAMRTVRHVV